YSGRPPPSNQTPHDEGPRRRCAPTGSEEVRGGSGDGGERLRLEGGERLGEGLELLLGDEQLALDGEVLAEAQPDRGDDVRVDPAHEGLQQRQHLVRGAPAVADERRRQTVPLGVEEVD